MFLQRIGCVDKTIVPGEKTRSISKNVNAKIRHLRILGGNFWPIGSAWMPPAAFAAGQDTVNKYKDGCVWQSAFHPITLHRAPIVVIPQDSKCGIGLHGRNTRFARVSGWFADLPSDQMVVLSKHRRTFGRRPGFLCSISSYARVCLRLDFFELGAVSRYAAPIRSLALAAPNGWRRSTSIT